MTRPNASWLMLCAISTLLLRDVVAPPSAQACSCSDHVGGAPPRNTSSDDFPSNGLLFDTHASPDFPVTWSAEVLVEEELDAISDSRIYRLSGASPGDVITRTDCETCSLRLVVGEEDRQSPSAAELVNTQITNVVGPEGSSGCVYDSLHFDVRASDDRTPPEDLLTLVYSAATREELDVMSAPSGLLAYSRSVRVEVILGARDGGLLRQTGPFCFAVAAMDLAGNIGARSDAVCLDTTDPNDPLLRTEVDPEPPCSCSVSPRGPNSTGSL